MIPIEIRNGVKLLRARGESLREISRLLKVSRNAVRRILREKDGERTTSPPCDAAVLARLEEAFKRAGGNGVRVQELLASEIVSSTSDFDGHVCTANEGRPVELVLRRPVPREDAVVLTPVNDEALRVALRRHH